MMIAPLIPAWNMVSKVEGLLGHIISAQVNTALCSMMVCLRAPLLRGRKTASALETLDNTMATFITIPSSVVPEIALNVLKVEMVKICLRYRIDGSCPGLHLSVHL